MNERRKPNSSCSVCSKQIYRRPIELQRTGGKAYCSRVCFGFSCRREVECVVCKTKILAGLHKKTCTRACANKLRTGIRYHTGRPRDKVKDQRAIKLRLIEKRGSVCERCGYSKVEILHVHHRDRDRKNNDLQNLELICPNCHFEEHYLEKSWLGGRVS
jgi:hypothetical protein